MGSYLTCRPEKVPLPLPCYAAQAVARVEKEEQPAHPAGRSSFPFVQFENKSHSVLYDKIQTQCGGT